MDALLHIRKLNIFTIRERLLTSYMTDDADSDSVEQTTAEKPHASEAPSDKGCHSTVSGAIGILTVLAAVVACLTTARRRRL